MLVKEMGLRPLEERVNVWGHDEEKRRRDSLQFEALHGRVARVVWWTLKIRRSSWQLSDGSVTRLDFVIKREWKFVITWAWKTVMSHCDLIKVDQSTSRTWTLPLRKACHLHEATHNCAIGPIFHHLLPTDGTELNGPLRHRKPPWDSSECSYLKVERFSGHYIKGPVGVHTAWYLGALPRC